VTDDQITLLVHHNNTTSSQLGLLIL